MKMYIRIDGDDDAMGASYEIRCDAFFLQQAIINLFKSLVNFSHGNICPAITCLKECADILEKENNKGGDTDV